MKTWKKTGSRHLLKPMRESDELLIPEDTFMLGIRNMHADIMTSKRLSHDWSFVQGTLGHWWIPLTKGTEWNFDSFFARLVNSLQLI